jgi:hypothetical protein
MNLKEIEREQTFAEIIAERDAMIKNLVQENIRQVEKIKELETPHPAAAGFGKDKEE